MAEDAEELDAGGGDELPQLQGEVGTGMIGRSCRHCYDLMHLCSLPGCSRTAYGSNDPEEGPV